MRSIAWDLSFFWGQLFNGITLPETQLFNGITIPETNVAPENRVSQKESHLPTIHFQGLR